jgi:hypothetical protein
MCICCSLCAAIYFTFKEREREEFGMKYIIHHSLRYRACFICTHSHTIRRVSRVRSAPRESEMFQEMIYESNF